MRIGKKPKKLQGDERGVQPTLALQIVNRYIRWILLLIVGVVILLGYSLLINRQLSQVRDVAQESLTVKEKNLADLKIIKQELDSVVIEFQTIKSAKRSVIERLDEILPLTPRYEELFTVIDDITERAGMRMLSINLGLSENASQRPRRAPESEGEAAGLVESGKISPITVNISVEGGTYETFKGYLDRLERNLRIIDVKSLSLDGNSFIPLEDGEVQVPRYDLELVTYYHAP